MPRDLNPVFDEFFEVGNVPATGCRLDIEVGVGSWCPAGLNCCWNGGIMCTMLAALL